MRVLFVLLKFNMDIRVDFQKISRLSLIFLSVMTILQTTECGSVTWYEPPPEVTTLDNEEVLIPTNRSLQEGQVANLSWNFTLSSGVNLLIVTINFNSEQAASISPSTNFFGVSSKFKGQFNVSWISQRATLSILNVTDAEDKGEFECVLNTYEGADNKFWKRKVQVKVVAPSRITSPSDNKTVTEDSDVELFCNVTGKPFPDITWTRVLEDGTNSKALFVGNPWYIINITRNYSGTYLCTADNGIGSAVNHTISINVNFKPDNVTLERNTTENDSCTDMWVNFTCHSCEANPPVHSYVFLKNETDVGSNGKRTWIDKISQGETFVYQCLAYQQVDNVTSTNKISLSVKVPPAVEEIQHVTVEEGRNVTLRCNVTKGIPPPAVFWENVKTGNTFIGNPLIITNIKRSQRGEYRFIANNTCGSDFTTTFIDVQFGPKDVTLEGNTTEFNGCVDIWVNFTCNSSIANPPAYGYLLLKNDTVVRFSKEGTWIQHISRGETFVYQCWVYQKIKNVTSTNSVTVTVNEPPAVEHLQNETLDEGSNLTKECNVIRGTPPLTVFWETSNTFEGNPSVVDNINIIETRITFENPLIINNIARSQHGQYRCIANNTCGRDSTMVLVDVQYKPDKVNLDAAPIGKVCRGSIVKFTCTADANPPVHTYVLFENDTRNSTDTFGTWTSIMNTSGKFFFKCEAHSLKGNGASKDTPLIVDDQPAVEQVQNLTVREGENVTGECNLTSGTPPLNLFWENVRTGQEVKSGKMLTITNITRYQTEYRCVAINTCGRDSTTMFIDVQYGPLANSQCRRTVSVGEQVKISCLQDRGNPSAVVTWYKGNDTSGNKTTNSSTLEFQNAASSDEGWYTCFATNNIGNVSATFFLSVVQKTFPAPTIEPSTASILCSEPPSANKFRGKAEVDADCKNRSEVATKLVDVIVELLKNEDCELGESCGTSCGSVVVDFILKFRKATDAALVVNILKEAAGQDRFNGLKVYPDSIIQISSTTTLSASTVRPSTEERCPKSFLRKENCEKNMLAIGLVIGFAAGMLLCCFLLIWWVHKQRKCKKDSKAVSPGDVQPLSSNHSTLSDGKPCDYAMSGPQPPVELDNEQQLGAVPTYAVVDKSRKKNKKKKEAAEQKPVDDQYAVADKSKKKKKNEADDTYTEVDVSKKLKKKPKPSEVLYADLGEFHSMKKMPEVSTSPKALPPINRPEAYAETQYADITQFLKGNPEDAGAELPKEITTPAVSNTAPGSKEESSAGNTGDGAKAANETGF